MALSRRGFLKASGMGFTALMVPGLPRWARAQTPPGDGVIVAIFLRGGADGMTHVVPRGDPWYDVIRPTIGLSPTGGTNRTSIPLQSTYLRAGQPAGFDTFFQVHEKLSVLRDSLFDTGRLAVVHASGGQGSHSHFTAEDNVERAKVDSSSSDPGWLHTALQQLDDPPEVVQGIAINDGTLESLKGAAQDRTVQIESVDSFTLSSGNYAAEIDAVTAANYGSLPADVMARVPVYGLLGGAAGSVFASLAAISGVPASTFDYGGAGLGSNYASFASRLSDAARLIKDPGVGTRAIALDFVGGWDYHSNIVAATPASVERLSVALTRFYEDLGSEGDRVCTVVMTEFGRTAYENGGVPAEGKLPGTDHGNGTVLYVVGGGVQGGRVLCKAAPGETAQVGWPGLGPGQLATFGNFQIPFHPDYVKGERDLAPTTDFRDVFAEVLRHQFYPGDPNADAKISTALNGHSPTPLPDDGLFGDATYGS